MKRTLALSAAAFVVLTACGGQSSDSASSTAPSPTAVTSTAKPSATPTPTPTPSVQETVATETPTSEPTTEAPEPTTEAPAPAETTPVAEPTTEAPAPTTEAPAPEPTTEAPPAPADYSGVTITFTDEVNYFEGSGVTLKVTEKVPHINGASEAATAAFYQEYQRARAANLSEEARKYSGEVNIHNTQKCLSGEHDSNGNCIGESVIGNWLGESWYVWDKYVSFVSTSTYAPYMAQNHVATFNSVVDLSTGRVMKYEDFVPVNPPVSSMIHLMSQCEYYPEPVDVEHLAFGVKEDGVHVYFDKGSGAKFSYCSATEHVIPWGQGANQL